VKGLLAFSVPTEGGAKMRILNCIALTFLMLVGSNVILVDAQVYESTTGKDEVAVYEATIEAIFPKMKFSGQPIGRFVIENRTRIDSYDGLGVAKQNVRELIKEIAPDTDNDFVVKRKEQQKLSDLTGLRFKYTLLDSSEIDGQFPMGNWRKFYQTFPDSPGLLSFSRVAFGQNGKQALVYVAHAWADDGGEGHLFLLKKTNWGWKIQAHEIPWLWVG
jgi:hypothetical protein